MSSWKTSKIKAVITDYGDICQKVQKLSGGPPEVLYQEEIFYDVPSGLFKLRTNADSSVKLLSYDEQNVVTKQDEILSSIFKFNSLATDFSAAEAKKLEIILTKSCGVRCQVAKERKLYKVDDINIYIDIVDGLGKFIKIELVYKNEHNLQKAQSILKDMQKRLEISDDDLTTTSYYLMAKPDTSTAS